MKTIVFFLEEHSAREMLQGLLPKLGILNDRVKYVVFQGKQHLEKELVKRLRGWELPDSVFVVMRDQDSGDCTAVKQKLTGLCQQAGREDVLVRIACHELESFYIGDLKAVENGLGITGIAAKQNKSKFRNPDNLANPSEELGKLTGGAYKKISGSRKIGKHLDPARNCSPSFTVLVSGIRKLMGAS